MRYTGESMRWPLDVFVFAAVVCFLGGCSGGGSEPSAGGTGLAEVLAKYGELFEQLPAGGVDVEAAIDEVAEAAVKEGRIRGEDARRELIFVFADDNLGLYLFEEARKRLDAAGAEALMGEVESRVRDSAVGAACFDARLAVMGADEVEGACSKALEEAGSDGARRGRVALYRRAICYRERGESKRGAFDALRLYGLHADSVEEMGAAGYVGATLKEAGYLLEADLVEKGPEPGRAAAWLWGEFSGSLSAIDGEGVDGLTATGIYVRHAPDVGAVESGVDGKLGTEFAGALHFAQMGRIALEAVEPEAAAERYELMAGAAEKAVGSELSEADSVQLAQVLAVSYLACESFMVKGGELRPNLEPVMKRLEPKASALGGKMLGLYLAARMKALGAGEEGSKTLFREVERVVEWARRDDHETVTGAYQTFLDRYPDSAEAPDVMASMADYYQVRMMNSAKAAELFAELIKRYPNAPNAEKAVLRQALAMYENKEYRQSLDTLAAFIASKPDSGNVATARYMSALAEAALGLTDDAQAHMTGVVNDYPGSALAPRALYWLGMNHVMRQAYGEAAEVFRMLVDRYPESEYAARARGYMENLEKAK